MVKEEFFRMADEVLKEEKKCEIKVVKCETRSDAFLKSVVSSSK